MRENESSTTSGSRTLGLRPSDRIVVLVLALVLAVACGATWYKRGPGAALLPTREDVIFRVNINTAGVGDLILLPGIGEKTAERIIAERALVPYSGISDLARVRGIGPATLERIAPYAECR